MAVHAWWLEATPACSQPTGSCVVLQDASNLGKMHARPCLGTTHSDECEQTSEDSARGKAAYGAIKTKRNARGSACKDSVGQELGMGRSWKAWEGGLRAGRHKVGSTEEGSMRWGLKRSEIEVQEDSVTSLQTRVCGHDCATTAIPDSRAQFGWCPAAE